MKQFLLACIVIACVCSASCKKHHPDPPTGPEKGKITFTYLGKNYTFNADTNIVGATGTITASYAAIFRRSNALTTSFSVVGGNANLPTIVVNVTLTSDTLQLGSYVGPGNQNNVYCYFNDVTLPPQEKTNSDSCHLNITSIHDGMADGTFDALFKTNRLTNGVFKNLKIN